MIADNEKSPHPERPVSVLADEIRMALDRGDFTQVRAYLEQRDPLLYESPDGLVEPWIHYFFDRAAVWYKNQELMELFLEFGADINGSVYFGTRCTVINQVALQGNLPFVEWLLEHGAEINHPVHGKPASMTLLTAAHMGHLDVTRYLVEHGAVVNFVNGFGLSPLDYAERFNHPELAEYLRSVGAKSGAELPRDHLPKPKSAPPTGASIKEHLVHCFGAAEDFPLREIVPGDPPVRLLRVPDFESSGYQAIVTDGMSVRLAERPSDINANEAMQRTELLVILDRNWPLDEESLKSDRHRWPIDWLRKIARWPFENNTCLRRGNIFANDEPPQPLADDTEQSCLLVTATEEHWGTWSRPDREVVRVMVMIPLHTAERDFERAHGMVALLEKLQESGFGIGVLVERPCVV